MRGGACEIILAAGLASCLACASAPREPERQTAEEFVRAHVPAPDEPEAAPPVETAPAPPGTVVIEDADEEAGSAPDLLAAARAERLRRQTAPPPSIVITDENLGDYATAELTLVSGISDASTGSESAADPDPAAGVLEREEYWRRRIREARQNLTSTREEIRHLEDRVAELRRRFYEEDDPYYRDSQIKPSWDRSLERLDEARAAARDFEERIEEILEEGRQAGALPGWLREGLELVPDSDDEGDEEEPREHEPREPTTVEVEEPPDGS